MLNFIYLMTKFLQKYCKKKTKKTGWLEVVTTFFRLIEEVRHFSRVEREDTFLCSCGDVTVEPWFSEKLLLHDVKRERTEFTERKCDTLHNASAHRLKVMHMYTHTDAHQM